MEKRVLEKLMFGSLIFFAIFLVAGWYLKIQLLIGSGLTLCMISMICWIELQRIDDRHRRLEKKYGKNQ